MREIKFRAWDRQGKYWTYLHLAPGGRFRVQHPASDDLDEWQEFTALKDKNGKDIYEGDIVSVPHFKEYNKKIILGSVAWGPGCWVLKDKKLRTIEVWNDGSHEWYDFSKLWPEDNAEIIGNIYETPALLK